VEVTSETEEEFIESGKGAAKSQEEQTQIPHPAQ